MAKPPANVCDGLTPMKTGNSNESLHLDPAFRLCSTNREWDPPVPAHSSFHDEEWVSSQHLAFPRDVIFPYFLLSFSFSSLSLQSSPSLSTSFFFLSPTLTLGACIEKWDIDTGHGKTGQSEHCGAGLTGTVYVHTLFQVLSFSYYCEQASSQINQKKGRAWRLIT